MGKRAKRELKRIIHNRERIEWLERTKKEIHIDVRGAGSFDYSRARVQTCPENELEKAGWKLLGEQQSIETEIRCLKYENEQIMKRMMTLDEMIFSKVLFLEFSEGMRLDDIAEEIGYSRPSVSRIKKAALEDYERRYLSKDDNE